MHVGLDNGLELFHIELPRPLYGLLAESPGCFNYTARSGFSRLLV